VSSAVYIKWGKRPDFAVVLDLKSGDKKCFNLWKSSDSIHNILGRERCLIDYLESLDDLAVVGYKKFVDYFGCLNSPNIYDIVVIGDKILAQIVSDYKSGLLFADWQNIRAKSVEVYKRLEDRGVYIDYKRVYPKYSNDVFSGRSKTTGFNIQGCNSEYDLKHFNSCYNLFLSFDWISADIKVCAYLSEDKGLNEAFECSDPYSYISDFLNNEISRDECKLMLNKAINSLNHNDPVFEIFPDLGKWVEGQVKVVEKRGFSKSILGRRFYNDNSSKGLKRVINSIFQGSVAHAMQNVLVSVDDLYGDVIFTEQHDSLVVSTSDKLMSKLVGNILGLMVRPLKGYCDVVMPLRVGLGKSWNNYKYFKERRL
jgi:hypothetical protein